jgi:hypothetical protein
MFNIAGAVTALPHTSSCRAAQGQLNFLSLILLFTYQATVGQLNFLTLILLFTYQATVGQLQ